MNDIPLPLWRRAIADTMIRLNSEGSISKSASFYDKKRFNYSPEGIREYANRLLQGNQTPGSIALEINVVFRKFFTPVRDSFNKQEFEAIIQNCMNRITHIAEQYAMITNGQDSDPLLDVLDI